jgi:ribosome-associated protein
MLNVSDNIQIPLSQIDFSAIRAQGAGGQNVNKVSSAIHLRFDIHNSSLPDSIKQRLLSSNDKRITKEGVVVIKAQQFRTQEKNRGAALERLSELILEASKVVKKRRPTRPSKSSKSKRMDEKTKHGRNKALRKNVRMDE